MALAMAGQPVARDDRRVRRVQLRVSAGAPRRRLVFNLEEALRLCWLPGEDEGRVYYFRYLSVGGLPENGGRRAWPDAFQRALLVLARRAVHGADGGARTADAVFFLSEQEACQSLLAMIVRRRPADAWFWPAVSGAPPGAHPVQRVIALIDKLLRTPASWVAVAAAVFAVVERDDPIVLLSLLSDAVVRRWLSELGNEEAALREGAPVRFSASMQKAIERAAAAASAEDPRVLWLASLAVILARPSELERGAVVSRARMTLRAIGLADRFLLPRDAKQEEPRRTPAEPNRTAFSTLDRAKAQREGLNLADRHDPQFSMRGPETFPENSDGTSARPLNAPAQKPATILAAPDDSRFSSDELQTAHENSDGTSVRSLVAPDLSAGNDLAGSIPVQPDAGSRRDRCLGETTSGAGLYFLLNALRWLRTDDDPLSPQFLARFFQRVAHYSGIERDDPILLWTLVTLDQSDPEEIEDRLLRIWVLEIRRWCWRNGKISVREIVRRPGLVTLTRTDLDISLALDSADIRIRRIGLDLDPGWLPWFGRVVRFHYLYRGELHA
jgi:hypothetical protein